jgi:hypothetical protein
MRLIQWLILGAIAFCFSTSLIAENEEPRKEDYKVARRYGYLKSDVFEAYRQKKSEVNIDKLNKEIKKKLSGTDFDRATLIEETLDNLIGRAVLVLSYEGHNSLADDIGYEYEQFYRFALTKHLLGIDEIGDHPPMNEWIDSVHERIHDAIGDMLCQYFRFHDIYILNHGIPVVFRPGLYDLKDYKDHFAGHLIWGWWWEHHGVAGVVAFWLVDGACIAGSYGLGVITFVCTPIATLAQNVMDKHIAPPVAEAIWKRAQENY